jgi:hypothetical protein
MIGRQPWVVPNTATRFYPRLVKLKFLAKTVSCHTVLAVARRFDIDAFLEHGQNQHETGRFGRRRMRPATEPSRYRWRRTGDLGFTVWAWVDRPGHSEPPAV